MRFIIIILSLTLVTACSIKKRQNVDVKGGYGYSFTPVDSSLEKSVLVIHTNGTTGVVFPASYSAKLFSNGEWAKGKTFFTPDTMVLKKVDIEVRNQYYKVMEEYWTRLTNGSNTKLQPDTGVDTTVKSVAETLSLTIRTKIHLLDRQYIGYETADGEKVIIAQYVDFSSDPHNLKSSLSRSWIQGWHGWFYNNLTTVHYNLSTNRVTLN